MGDHNSVASDVILLHGNPNIVGTSMFTRTSWARRKLGFKWAGGDFDHLYHTMARMNFSGIPNDLLFITSVPEKSLFQSYV